VRLYLRKMGTVSLLTREGEVEIAKRIEDGECRVLQVVLNSAVAIEEILDLGNQLRQPKDSGQGGGQGRGRGRRRVRRELARRAVCKVIEKVRRLHTELQKVEEKETSTEAARKKVRNQVRPIKQEMIGALQTMRLNRKQIDLVSSARLKGLVSRIEAAQREIADCEQRAGMPERSFRKTLREIRSSSLRQRAVSKKLGLRPDEIEDLAKGHRTQPKRRSSGWRMRPR